MATPEKLRAPAYPWYPRDFDMDEEVKLMTYEEEGIYRRLLDHQWFHDGLPAEIDRIARLVPKVPSARFKKLWPAIAPKFLLVDGRLVNPKLEQVRRGVDEYTARQRHAGRLSATARRQRHGSAQPSRPPNESPNDSPNGVRTTARTTGATNAEVAFASASTDDDTKNVSSSASTTPERRTVPDRRTFGRIFLHRWQLDALIDALGTHVETFALDLWIDGLTAKADAQGLTFPTKEARWEWVQAELQAEIVRRGLPVASGKVVAMPTRPSACRHEPPCLDDAEHTRRDMAERRMVGR